MSRPRRLFPRSLSEVVKAATQPLMQRQGQVYGALLRDWVSIIGPERAQYITPQRAQFSRHEGEGITLHVNVSAEKAPEVSYMQQALLEALARYFGYRAVTRLVLHTSYDRRAVDSPTKPLTPPAESAPKDLKDIFKRLQKHFSDKA